MSIVEIAVTVIAVAFCGLALTLIPTLLAIKRSAESVGELAEMVQVELKPTLQELTGVLTELKSVGESVAGHAGDVERFMSALGETGTNLCTINRSVGVVTSILNTTSVWVTGSRVAVKYLFERYLNKRGGI